MASETRTWVMRGGHLSATHQYGSVGKSVRRVASQRLDLKILTTTIGLSSDECVELGQFLLQQGRRMAEEEQEVLRHIATEDEHSLKMAAEVVEKMPDRTIEEGPSPPDEFDVVRPRKRDIR